MDTRTLFLGGVAALALALPASAAQFEGWYVGIEGGGSWVQDADFTNHVLNVGDFADTYSFKTGWAGFFEAGYAFTPNWRVEGEVGYRSNKIEDMFFVGKRPTAVRGTLNELTLMANVLYDIKLMDKVTLTLGAGAGADQARLKSSFPTAGFSDQSWDFAYQGIAGLSYALGRRSQVFVNYRYLRDTKPSFADLGRTYEFEDLQKHAVTIGFRYAFQHEEPAPMVAPPPPAPPPGPPPTVKSFVIFFGFNKCNITAEADNVLGEAASTAKSTGAAAIQIVGHTDTSGSPKYNQKLSECRANAAAKNLEGKGVAAGSIHKSGVGETDLMVQTGDGVKEPQNRRATIDLN